MKNCVNFNSPDVVKLAGELNVSPVVAAAKIGVWQSKNNIEDRFPTVDELQQSNEVNYTLKAVDILMSDKGKEIFNKGKKANWDLNKILTELQVPKEQKQLILDLGITDREQIALELASNYSHTVEINTAKYAPIRTKVPVRDLTENEENALEFLDEEDLGIEYNIVETGLDKNTNYYSNLTVPGGTNYTENEIATPLITPSIKGHAQFATDKGIGWFRSDDKIDNKTTDLDLKNIYIKEGYDEEMSFDSFKLYYYEKEEINPTTNTKTRRILEVQSDLFQKGRDLDDLVTKQTKGSLDTFSTNMSNLNRKLDKGEISLEDYRKERQILEDNRKLGEKFRNLPDNQFLQLLNKDSNWVTFFVKSIVQDSAKKGYEKVVFPTGDTASKVEGHTTLKEYKKQKEDRIKELEKNRQKAIALKQNVKKEDLYLTTYGEDGFDKVDFNTLEELQEFSDRNSGWENEDIGININGSYKVISSTSDIDREIAQIKQELERVEGPEGFGALKPIYNFYENTLTNILNKTYGKENVKQITDEYGNTWNEVIIIPKFINSFLLSKKSFNNLIGKTEAFGVYKESEDAEDEQSDSAIKNEIINTLFNGEIKNTSANNILLNILASGIYKDNSLMLNLINKLLDTKANVKITDILTNEDAYMTYDTNSNSINISEDTIGQVNSVEEGVSKFLHEVFHDKTIRILRNPQTADELKLVGDIKKDYTKVKNFLQEQYPHEMSSIEEFTAGMFSNKEFEAEVKQILDNNGFWNNIKNFFKKLFNLNSNYDLLMNNVIELASTTNTSNEFEDILDSKYNIGAKKIEEKNSLNELSDKINNVLNVLQIQSLRLNENSAFKKKLRTTTKEIAEAEKKFDKDINAYRKEVIKIFLNFMTGQLYSVDARILNAKKFDSRIFNSSKVYIESFISIQEDIDKALDELNKANDISEDDFNTFKTSINNLEGVALRAKQNLIKTGKNHIKNNNSQFVKGYKEVELRYKYIYEREGKSLGLNGGALDEYINKKISENRDVIKNETSVDFNNMLDHPIADIDSLSTMFNSEKDFTHPIINIFSSILDKVKHTYENIIQNKLVNLQEKTNIFLEGKRTKSSDEVYKNLVEVSKSGTTFLKGEYSIEYHDIVNDLKTKKEELADTLGKESDEYKEALKKYLDFIEENTIALDDFRRLPIDKWKTNLSSLNEDERKYLKEIQNLAKESHLSYGIKTKSLKKTVGYADYYELPKIRKAQITSLKSGNLIETAKEFYNETFTRQTDQEDLGQEEAQDNVYKVYTDLSGKEVRYIPIHYRIPIDQKYQSIDLPTIYALEYQNAVKFKQKNIVANDLLMFKDIIQEGKFIKKKGFGNRDISSVYDKNNKAIEYSKEDAHLIKMLDTMLNNRLYDKTTEYAGKIFGKDVNKVEAFLRGTISKASMALNFIGAPANLITGKSQSLLEVIRDPNLTLNNFKNA